MSDAADEFGRLAAGLDRVKVAFARLAAKSSQQQAEIERLTPKPMTLREACDALNANRYSFDGEWDDRSPWEPDPDFGIMLTDGENRLTLFEATAIAEKLLRDSGPLVASEERSEG